MATLEKLLVHLGVDDDLTAGFTRARSSLKTFVADVEKSSTNIDKLGSGLAKVGATIGKVGAGLAAMSSSVQAIGGLASVAATASGALLLLPAAAGAGALAIGTLKVGLEGFADALGDNPKKAAEALAKMAPAAQESVGAIKALEPAWKALKLDVQQQMFEGLSSHISTLGKTYIPILQGAMRGLAADMNYAAQTTALVFANEAKATQMSTALGQVRQAFGSIMDTVAPLAEGLSNIFAVGASFLPGLVSGAGSAAEAFAAWTRDTENLRRIMSEGLSTFGQLGQVAGNIGSIISGIFDAATVSGGGFLNNLVMITGQIATMVNSAQGQETLTTLFATGAQLAGLLMQALQALLPVLPPLVSALGQVAVILGTALAGALTAIAPLLQSFAEWAAANPGVLAGTIVALAALVAGVKGILVLGEVVKMAKGVVDALNLIKQGFTAVSTAFNVLKLAFMANPWLLLIGAVIALVAIIITNWDTIKTYLAAAWEWIKTTATTVWNAIVSFFSTIWTSVVTVVQTVWGAITGFLSTVWSGIVAVATAIWTPIIAFFSAIWDAVVAVFQFVAGVLLAVVFSILNPIIELWTTTWSAILDVATVVWDAISSAISTALNFIWGVIQTVWNAILSVITTVLNAVWGVVSSVWNTIWGFLGPILETIGSAIATAWNAISSVISTVMNAVWGVVSSVWNTIAGFFSDVWARISSVVSDGANRVWDFLTGLWDRIKGIAGEAIGWLVDAGRNIVTGLWNGIAAMGTWLYDKIMGWVRSTVPAPILEFLGIASPSRLMRDQVGEMIPAGIGEGIIAGARQLTRVAEGLAADTAAAAGRGAETTDIGAAWSAALNRIPVPEPAREPAMAAAPVVNLTVNNPVGEPTHVSVNRDMQLLSALGTFRR
ncbi:hypothetical protein ACL02T_32910 [Pseudonocardia sp. RS010]|uniref:phage tail protein n=1 Tax=Pseudonocardia sp. RS010 TaxID=3385979 RepID=UPI0039A1BE9B